MRKFVHVTLAAAMVLLVLAPAHAGGRRKRARAAACAVQYQPAAIQMVPGVGTVAVTAQPGGDAAAFVAWLNATRANYGLPPVAYSAEVEASCAQNNVMQAAYGMGHHFFGCHRRQNAAAGLGFPGVETVWMGSSGHASALLDPTIRFVGIAWYGAYCTFGAY